MAQYSKYTRREFQNDIALAIAMAGLAKAKETLKSKIKNKNKVATALNYIENALKRANKEIA